MNVFKKLLFVKKCSSSSAGICFLAMASVILLGPGIFFHQNVRAAIDETMPDSIPTEIIADWMNQDQLSSSSAYSNAITSIIEKLPAAYTEKFNAEKADRTPEQRYLLACHYRRLSRMKSHEADLETIMFARHHNFGGVGIGYHDNSDTGCSDMEWVAKSALCVLRMKNYYSRATDLLPKTDAVVRDPCISFDGKKVLFAISGKGKGTGYKIYEMDIADTTKVKQLTDDDGLGAVVADFEPCYLPNGNIMFTSTRNFGMGTHGFNPTTNMFLMNSEGNFMRQVGFDQANTFYPVLQDDGTVLYSRWEYNDRNITSNLGLFTMYPDGSHQTEYFGNQTSWPMTMIHARPIPGAKLKVLCIAGGHHGPYAGELMIIDLLKGSDGKQSITMVAPKRETKPDVKKSDMAMGDVHFLFQTPCPLDDTTFLVSWRTSEKDSIYKLYFMDVDGSRELLAWADQSVSQPVLIKPRKISGMPVLQANYNDNMGTYCMDNVYYGEGMKGIEKGAAKSLRVVKLSYRVSGLQGRFGQMLGSAPSGAFATAVTCPVSAYGASWEAKEVLGEAKICEDGSAAFKVPARTPVYFQVLDSNGYCIATMRSWSALMPGERFTCAGCHESKIDPPPVEHNPLANPPQKLDTLLGIENRPFDYPTLVQPIFDKHCANCHTADHESGFDLSGTLVTNVKRYWATSYNSLLKGIGPKSSNDAINICTIFSATEQQPPRSFGSSLSGIMLTGGMSGSHHKVAVTTTEKKIVACWIDLAAPYAGTYNSHMAEADSTAYEKLMDKRRAWEAIEQKNIRIFQLADRIIPDDHGTVPTTRSTTEKLSLGYAPQQRALVIYYPCKGKVMVVDLRGTVVYRMQIADQRMDERLSIALPSSLTKGIYVARFEGVHGTLQTKVSITQ